MSEKKKAINRSHLRRTVFEPYYGKLFAQAAQEHGGAMTPAQELAFIQALRNRTLGIGHEVAIVPTEGTELRLPADADVVAKLRAGDDLTAYLGDGAKAAGQTKSDNGRFMIAGGVGLLLLVGVMLGWLLMGSGGSDIKASGETETTEIVAEIVAIEVTALPSTDTPQPTATPQPTETPVPTATAIPDYLAGDGLVMPSANQNPRAPDSLEIDGYFLSVKAADSGERWKTPEGVEWWAGTHIRRVFAMPSDRELLERIKPETVITVRLRSGAMQRYVLSETRHVHRLQTELLAEPMPSVVLIFVNPGSDERTVAIGHAVQTND